MEDLREAADGLVVGRRVDAGCRARRCRSRSARPASRCRASRPIRGCRSDLGSGCPSSTISGRFWRANTTTAGTRRAAVPGDHVVAAVCVAHERGLAVAHRRVGVPVRAQPPPASAELEAAVEGREQVRAQATPAPPSARAWEVPPRARAGRGRGRSWSREVLIQATPATRRGYSAGSLRNVRHEQRRVAAALAGHASGSICPRRAAPAGQRRDRLRAGRRSRPPPAPRPRRRPVRGSARSAGPPLAGAVSE